MKRQLEVICLVVLITLLGCNKDKAPAGPGVVVAESLLTIKRFSLDNSNNFSSAYFIATDEEGKIIAEVKHTRASTEITIVPDKPYDKERFNLFIVKVPSEPKGSYRILGYLQVKKGSEFTEGLGNPTSKSSSTNLRVDYLNISPFNRLSASTDSRWDETASATTAGNGMILTYADNSKLWVQAVKSTGVFYNFFDITKGSTNITVNLNDLTKVALSKTITAPGNIIGVWAVGTPDKNFYNHYIFGNVSAQGQTKKLDYYYPSEQMASYSTSVNFWKGSYTCVVNQVGLSIAENISDFDATFTVQGKTMSDFKPTVTGAYDYYEARFGENNLSDRVTGVMFSPSAASYSNVRMPDFSKYMAAGMINPAQLKLNTFSINQIEGFDEKKFDYSKFNTNLWLNGKSLTGFYQ